MFLYFPGLEAVDGKLGANTVSFKDMTDGVNLT
jgi:hypothetical protein